MIRIETPEDFQLGNVEDEQHHIYNNSNNNIHDFGSGSKHKKEPPCAIKLRAEVSLTDILEDSKDIDGYIKNSLDLELLSMGATSTAAASNAAATGSLL